MSEHEYEPTSEEIAEQEEERRCGMMDPEAWEVYQEAKKRGLDTVKAVERWYAGVPQEWEKSWVVYHEAKKRGLDAQEAVERWHTGEPQEWEEESSLQETYQKVVSKMEETKMEGKRFTVL